MVGMFVCLLVCWYIGMFVWRVPAEQRYTPMEGETLTVVWGLEQNQILQ